MIRDVPVDERPRERLMQYGATALSNAELIAILLRTGTSSQSAKHLAERILSAAGGLKGLTDSSIETLTQVKGIGPAKAVQVLAGVELGRRISRALPEERFAIRSPQDAADLMMDELQHLQQEHFVCLFLNTKNEVLAKETVFVGSLNASIVHPREVFKRAISRVSAAIICLHNHPSGDPTPSREDRYVTKRLKQAGELIGIDVLDHIIIGEQRFYSMKDNGLM
ncbi:RadC family protein [Numidum massiliense]|uniref:RadC family protein n=1 Tax=Numidum massiliense TaxID=1522315 RepID=UPI0006D52E9B|nr:DNA repair protein RadC [Numidum massiliense]